MGRREPDRVTRRSKKRARDEAAEEAERGSGRKHRRRSGDGTIPLGDPKPTPAATPETAAEAAAERAAEEDDERFAEDMEPGEFVFGEDEDKVAGERTKEEKWYELVERKLAGLPRPEGNDRRTVDGVFDKRTLMTLYKLLSNGMIDTLDFPISTGKEADVFRATTPEGTYLCVKIFRTNTATFHDVLQYIQGDPRFQGIKREKHGLVQAWASKEYRNLGRSIDNGVRVPEPVVCLDNVLIMEYIGEEAGPAPLLKDVEPADPEAVTLAILDDYHRMLVDGHLVHADLSEYNILWAGDHHVIIDVGQAVLLEHPMAEEFFERDVKNLARYFTRMGAPRTADQVRRHVLGEKHESFSDLL